MKILSVVGARPNFMKIAPIVRELRKYSGVTHKLVHTGQHYDEKMSKVFFQDLELPKPDYNLGVGSGSHANQTAKIMIELELILIMENPDLVIVVGDVNSTLAAALTAKKLNFKVAHIEAGLRSFDREMPEEINRIVVDSISDYLFVTEQSGIDNLKGEGIPKEKIFLVGNTMIDSLIHLLPKAQNPKEGKYILATIHRPSNVDNLHQLREILRMLNTLSEFREIIFPVHPRTLEIMNLLMQDFSLSPNITITKPMGYLEFVGYMRNAELVITDSGGVQEETTYLNIPCITLRTTTERPITIEKGTNYLCHTTEKAITKSISIFTHGGVTKRELPFWDGKAAERIVNNIRNYI